MGLREQKRAATASAIELCALELFETRGYAATTVDDIAAAANVSRATIFRYFPSKEDIVFAAFLETEGQLRELCRTHKDNNSYELSVGRVLGAFMTELVVPDHTALRVHIIESDRRLLSHALLLEARWAAAIIDELAGDDPTVTEVALAYAASSAARAATHEWAKRPSRDFADVLAEALAAIAVPLR